MDDDEEEERLRRDALLAPVRLLAGLVSGGVLGLVCFGLSWAAFMPSSFESLLQALVVFGTIGLSTAALGAFVFMVRPIRRWWHLLLLVALGAVGGWVGARPFRDALLVDCLRGTGPQERWCTAGYSFVALFVASAAAGAFVAAAMGALGVRPSQERDKRREAT